MKERLTGFILLMAIWLGLSIEGRAATRIHSPAATPLTITFSANDPDNPTVAGNSAATITFTTTSGSNTNAWQVQVQATSANFASCPNALPVSKVTVTCVSATVGNGGTAACSAPSALSTTLRTVASGLEGSGGGNTSYSVTLSFTFTDSWGYIATPSGAPCTIGLNYVITAN